MAKLEIYEPICGVGGCAARATRRIVSDDGSAELLTCTKHAQQRLIEWTKVEAAAQKQKPQAVRS